MPRESITLGALLPVELVLRNGNHHLIHMIPRYILVAIVLAATLAAGILLALRLQNPAAPEFALVLPAPDKVPEFSLVDQHGNPADQSVFEGQWDLVFFGFTHCPDICPTTLQVLSAAKAALEEQGQSPLPRIVLVSVDPERDSPEIMGEYVDYFGDGNLGITGTVEEISKLTSGLGIYFKKQPSDGSNYNVDHSAAVLLINPGGGFHALFGGPHVVDNYVHDLPIIMAEN
jgi:protein SCO1/2